MEPLVLAGGLCRLSTLCLYNIPTTSPSQPTFHWSFAREKLQTHQILGKGFALDFLGGGGYIR
jgi:hypothetical protein